MESAPPHQHGANGRSGRNAARLAETQEPRQEHECVKAEAAVPALQSRLPNAIEKNVQVVEANLNGPSGQRGPAAQRPVAEDK